MDLVINPTLIIGIGGTGYDIAHRLRRRLKQRVGTDQLPGLEFIFVDTDRGTPGAIRIGMSATEGQRLMQPGDGYAEEMELHRMLDERAKQLLAIGAVDGARNKRPLGHVCFLRSDNLKDLDRDISDGLQKVLSATRFAGQEIGVADCPYLRHRVRAVGDTANIWVLASAGGGTGSGCLIDMAYFIRRAMALRAGAFEPPEGPRYRLFGVALIASNLHIPQEGHQHRVNSMGLLIELNHHLLGRGYRGAYPSAFPGQPLIHDSDRTPENLRLIPSRVPFDCTYIVQPTYMGAPSTLGQDLPPQPGQVAESNDDSRELPLRLLQQKVAELILSETICAAPDLASEEAQRATTGSEVRSRRPDMTEVTTGVGSEQGFPCSLWTFGVTTREWPATMHHLRAYHQACRNIALRWARRPELKFDPALPSVTPVEKKVLGLLAVLSVRREVDYRQTTGRERDPDQDPLLQAILAGEDLAGQLLDLTNPGRDLAAERIDEWRQRQLNRVSEQFQDRAWPVERGEPGYVTAYLAHRTAELSRLDSDEGLPYKVCSFLLETAFALRSGPGTALVCAEHMERMIGLERDYIESCLSEPTKPPRRSGTEEDGPKADPLLFWPWTAYGRPKVDPGPVAREVRGVANDRLTALVLAAKLRILDAVLDSLAKLKTRLGHMVRYCDDWRDAMRDDPAFEPSPEEALYLLEHHDPGLVAEWSDIDGVVLKLDDFEPQKSLPLYTQLVEQMRAGFPDKIRGEYDRHVDAVFAAGPPLDHATLAPTFKPLEPIERYVFEQIANAPEGPYAQEAIRILIAKAEQAGGAYPDLQAEARPLLSFDPTQQLYTDWYRPRFGRATELWLGLYDQSSAGYESLQKELKKQEDSRDYAGTIEKSTMEVRSNYCPYVVSVVRHIVGVVSLLIQGYELATVQRAVGGAGNDKDGRPLAPLTDMRIKLPVTPESLREGQMLYLGGLVLGTGRPFSQSERGFSFQYEVSVGPNQAPRTVTIDLKGDLFEGGEDLARNEEARKYLKIRTRSVLDQMGDNGRSRLEWLIGALAHDIGEHQRAQARGEDVSATPVARQVLHVWRTPDQLGGAVLHGVHYPTAIDLLCLFATEFDLEVDFQAEHPYAVRVAKGGQTPSGARAETTGWYCSQADCGVFLSYRWPPSDGECKECHYPRQ